MSSPILPDVSSNLGAPMGRPSCGSVPRAKMFLSRVRLTAGGYDAGGAYWGVGLPLWWATDGQPGGLDLFFRAPDREEAKCVVHRRLAGTDVRFYR